MKPLQLNLDIKNNSYEELTLMQGYTYPLEATLTDGGQAFDLTGHTVTLELLKADNTFIIQSETITTSGNVVKVAMIETDFTRASGTGKLQVVARKGGLITGSWVVNVRIKEGAIVKAVGESKDIITIKETIDNTVQKAIEENKKTEQMIATGGAASKGDVIKLTEQMEDKASKTTTDNMQGQINNLVLNGDGTQNLEVVQSRVDFEGNIFQTLKDKTDNIENIIYNNQQRLIPSNWENGTITSGTPSDNTGYIRTVDFITLPVGTKLKLTPSSTSYYSKVLLYDDNGNYKTSHGETNTERTILLTYPKVKIVIRKSGTTNLPLDAHYNIKISKEKKIIDIDIINDNINLFNGKLNNGYIGINGEVLTHTSWFHTDFISVNNKDLINCNHTKLYSGNDCVYIAKYDINKNLLGTIKTITYPIVINFDGFVKIPLVNSDVNFSNIQIQKNKYIVENGNKKYIKDLFISANNIDGDLGNVSVLKDKKIGFLGDSFTEGENSYPNLIQLRTGCISNNYGQGGSRITNDNVYSGTTVLSFIHRINTMVADLDVICFYGGINDSANGTLMGSNLGTINDIALTQSQIDSGLEPTTFYSGVKTLIDLLIRKYPQKPIICIIPPHVLDLNYNPTHGAYVGIEKAVKALRECSEFYGIPTIDLYKNCISLNNHPINVGLYRLTSNNIHPNNLGQLAQSNDIQKSLENLLY